ncbi:hypothetical protein D3C77_456910 [compost metagenome]
MPGRQPQAAHGRARIALAGLGLGFAHQRGVFIDPPDQAVAHGDGFAGLECHQAFAAAQGDLVLDERGTAIYPDTVAVDDVFIDFAGHAHAHVLAQFIEVQDAVLEVVVVLDIGVIQGHDPVEVAMLPAQVVAQDGGGGFRGLFRAVGDWVWGH